MHIDIIFNEKKTWSCTEVLTISTGAHTEVKWRFFTGKATVKFSKNDMS